MKKILLFLFAAGSVVVGNAQFVLEGKTVNSQFSRIYLTYNDSNGANRTDSALVEKGIFRFAGSIKEPVFATLSTVRTVRSVESPDAVTIVLEPAKMTATITGDNIRDVAVTGSRSHSEYSALEKQLAGIRARWKVVMDTLSAVNQRSNVQFQELKEWVLKPYNAETDEVYSTFFKKHPSSLITAYFLRFKALGLTADSLTKLYNKLSLQAKQSTYGEAVYAEIEKKKKGIPGVTAPEFSAVDIDGKPLKLSDFKGRYILLDFWASWCVPCRKGNPHLIKLYNQYKSKGFEIIGISDDDRKPEEWRKAVAQDGIGMWKHVLRGLDIEKRMKNLPNPLDISEKYGISTLPTKILINKEGVIIGRYGSEETELDAKLAEVMGS